MVKLNTRSICRQNPAAAKKVYDFSATTPNPQQASSVQWAWLGWFPACSLPGGVSLTEGGKSFGVVLSKWLAHVWHFGADQDLSFVLLGAKICINAEFSCARTASARNLV